MAIFGFDHQNVKIRCRRLWLAGAGHRAWRTPLKCLKFKAERVYSKSLSTSSRQPFDPSSMLNRDGVINYSAASLGWKVSSYISLYIVVIGSSPPLAYCTIFIIISSKGTDLHICICIRTGHCLHLCMHTLRAANLVSPCGSRDQLCVQSVGAISGHFSSRMLLNKGRQCCEFWREAQLRVHAVRAVGDTTGKNRVSICCAVRHTVTLPRAVWRTILSLQSVRVLGAMTTDAARPTTPAVRSVGAVYHAVRQRANRLLQLLATTVGDILVLYTML